MIASEVLTFNTHLLQRRVGHAEAAEADVHHGFLQLPEEASVGSRLEVSVRKQVGQLLANGLDQTSLRHMMMDQSRDVFHVSWGCVEEVHYASVFNMML